MTNGHCVAIKPLLEKISSMSVAERSKAIENLVASINGLKIQFDFRKVDPDLQGLKALESVADCMSFLPDYAIRVEGYSNLQKQEAKLTAEDKVRIQKLSEDRADACARMLKAAGVHNDITWIGYGALAGEKKGCVRVVVFPKATPTQNPELSEYETDLPSILRPRKDATVVVAATHKLREGSGNGMIMQKSSLNSCSGWDQPQLLETAPILPRRDQAQPLETAPTLPAPPHLGGLPLPPSPSSPSSLPALPFLPALPTFEN